MLRNYWSYSAGAAKAYFDQELRLGDYYAQGQEIAGQWGGRGAERLGLSGTVDREAFHQLVDNLNPNTGEGLTARTNAHRRVLNDMNFHYPKGVSVVEGITGDTRIRASFLAAADQTMREMEQEVKARVRVGGQDSDRTTGNLVWARFDHSTARPVDGMADPQGHSHYTVFNATYDAEEDKWKAVQIADLIRDKGYFEARFEARFARSLGDLGYQVARDGKGYWDIDLPGGIKETFSKRKHQIERAAEKLGVITSEAKHTLGKKLRASKDKGKPLSDLRKDWDNQLSDPERAAIWQAFEGADGTPSGATTTTPDQALEYAVAHGYERQSVVSRRKLEEHGLRRGVGSLLPETMADRVQEEIRRGELLAAEVNSQEMATTPTVLAEEQAMVQFVRAGRGSQPAMAPASGVEWHDALFVDPTKDTDEQKAAITAILSSTDRVMLLRGGAGTGKTTLARELAHQVRQGGREVHAFAPTAAAARDVLREEGFTGADTVARLLTDTKMQARTREGVIWIDEAGLLGAQDMHAIFKVAEQQQARVILTGDQGQHHAVSRGDAVRTIAAYSGAPVVQVQKVQRQRGVPEYRRAVEAISQGAAEAGFQRLDRMGWIQEFETLGERHEALANAYLRHREAGRSVLVVSPTHAEGEAVTGAIRARLKQAGGLDSEEREVERLIDLSWTDAEKGDRARYREGLVVQFHQNVKGGFKRGSRHTVVGDGSDSQVAVQDEEGQVRPLTLEAGQRFSVYQASTVDLAARDQIRITKNGTTKDRHRLNNGAVYELDGFTAEGDMRLGNGWILSRDFGHIAHGHVQTSHAVQGKTKDVVLIAQGAESFSASSLEQFYVSVSRGKREATIFTNDKEALAAVIKASQGRPAAMDLERQANWQATKQRRQRLAVNLDRYRDTRAPQQIDRRDHGSHRRQTARNTGGRAAGLRDTGIGLDR